MINTIKIPKISKIISIGSNQYFFLTFIKSINSFKKSIIKIVYSFYQAYYFCLSNMRPIRFKFIVSLRNIFIKIPVGVTTAKKIMNIIIGEINFPKNTPNLIQILFSGLKIEGFKIVIKSKTIAINKD